MSKMTRGLISKILLDGAYRQIPGLELNPAVGSYGVPFPIVSGLLDCVNAVAAQAPFFFNFRAKILGGTIRVRTQLGTALAHVLVGKVGDTDWIADNSVPTTDVAGTLRQLTILNSGLMVPGDVLIFGSDGGATATGDVDVTLWAAPWLGA